MSPSAALTSTQKEKTETVDFEKNGWYVNTTIEYKEKINDFDFLFDVIEEFYDYDPVPGFEKDNFQVTMSLFVEADSLVEATSNVLKKIKNSETTQNGKIIEFELCTEERRKEKNTEPLFPELVSYTEIGNLCNISRQRARAIAQKSEEFPQPAIVTGQGPLYVKDAILEWDKTRNKKSGRPTTV